MDSFQGDLFAELLDEDRNLAQRFDGFVYYPNITAVAPITLGALPAIYSGSIYTGGPLREFYKDMYRDMIFSDARKAGYSTVLYGHYYFGMSGGIMCQAAGPGPGLDRPILASYLGLLDYGLLRISPTSLHDLIYRDGLALTKQPPTIRTQTIDSLRGLKTFTERSRVGDEAPTFKFLHLMNRHFPLNIDEECKIAPKRPRTRSNFKVQTRCGPDAFRRLVAFLERSSIYDSGLIVLMSDHGSSLSEPSQPRTLDGKIMYSGRYPQRDGVRDEEIQTFTLSGSVEDLDQVRDSAGRPLR